MISFDNTAQDPWQGQSENANFDIKVGIFQNSLNPRQS